MNAIFFRWRQKVRVLSEIGSIHTLITTYNYWKEGGLRHHNVGKAMPFFNSQ